MRQTLRDQSQDVVTTKKLRRSPRNSTKSGAGINSAALHDAAKPPGLVETVDPNWQFPDLPQLGPALSNLPEISLQDYNDDNASIMSGSPDVDIFAVDQPDVLYPSERKIRWSKQEDMRLAQLKEHSGLSVHEMQWQFPERSIEALMSRCKTLRSRGLITTPPSSRPRKSKQANGEFGIQAFPSHEMEDSEEDELAWTPTARHSQKTRRKIGSSRKPHLPKSAQSSPLPQLLAFSEDAGKSGLSGFALAEPPRTGEFDRPVSDLDIRANQKLPLESTDHTANCKALTSTRPALNEVRSRALSTPQSLEELPKDEAIGQEISATALGPQNVVTPLHPTDPSHESSNEPEIAMSIDIETSHRAESQEDVFDRPTVEQTTKGKQCAQGTLKVALDPQLVKNGPAYTDAGDAAVQLPDNSLPDATVNAGPEVTEGPMTPISLTTHLPDRAQERAATSSQADEAGNAESNELENADQFNSGNWPAMEANVAGHGALEVIVISSSPPRSLKSPSNDPDGNAQQQEIAETSPQLRISRSRAKTTEKKSRASKRVARRQNVAPGETEHPPSIGQPKQKASHKRRKPSTPPAQSQDKRSCSRASSAMKSASGLKRTATTQTALKPAPAPKTKKIASSRLSLSWLMASDGGSEDELSVVDSITPRPRARESGNFPSRTAKSAKVCTSEQRCGRVFCLRCVGSDDDI